MKSIFFLLACFFAFNSNAGSIKCASSDHGFQYLFQQPDGGPAIGPTWTLKLNGVTVIGHSAFGGPETRSADLEWVGVTKDVKKTSTQDYETTYYLQDAKVTSTGGSGEVLFEDTVFCQSQKYVGLPRP